MTEVFSRLLMIAMYSSVIMLATIIVKTAFKDRISNKIIMLLWMLCLLRMLMPITISSPIHIDELMPKVVVESPVNVTEAPSEIPIVNNSQINSDFSNIEFQSDFSKPVTTTSTITKQEPVKLAWYKMILGKVKAISLLTWLSYIWLIGFICFSIKNIIQIALYHSKLKQSQVSKHRNISSMLNKLKFNMLRNVAIYESDIITTPMTYGVVYPKIMLPKGFSKNIDKDKLTCILLHELCHIKRFDTSKNLLWLVCISVYWFNPLVMIAYRSYIEDVEIACDELVISKISNKQKIIYSQSLIDVLRFSKDEPKSILGLSFLNDKSKIRRRVENMIKPKKKFRFAGIMTIVLTLVMLPLCFTTACQPSEKEQGTTPNQTNTRNITTENVKLDNYETPEKYEYENVFSEISLTVDAVVVGPQDKNIKFGTSLNYDLYKDFVDYFVGNKKLYQSKDNRRTKSSILDEINTWKEAINLAQSKWEDVKLQDPFTDYATIEEAVEDLNGYISRLEEEYKTAPKANEYTEVSSEFSQDEDGNLYLEGYVQTSQDDFSDMASIKAYEQTIYLEDSESVLSYNQSFAYTSSGMNKQEIEETYGLTFEQAYEKAIQEINHFNLGEFHLDVYNVYVGIKNGELLPIFDFKFLREINSQEVQMYFDENSDSLTPKTEYIRIEVTKDEVLSFTWHSPNEIDSAASVDIEILPFEEVVKVFEDKIWNTLYANDERKKIHISNISFDTIPTKSQDSDLMVMTPVWNFIGYYYNTDNEENIVPKTESENKVLLTINAIDGTYIINPAEYGFKITPDDATYIAKQFLVSEYHYDSNKIVVNDVSLDTAILPLRYWIDCEYGTKLYNIGVHVDTGQIDGVSKSSFAYNVDYTLSDDVVIEEAKDLKTLKVMPDNIPVEALDKAIKEFVGDEPVYYRNTKKLYDGTLNEPSANIGYYGDFGSRSALVSETAGKEEVCFQLTQTEDQINTGLDFIYTGGGENGDGASGGEWSAFNDYTGVDIKDMDKSFDECLDEAYGFIEKLIGEKHGFEFDCSYTWTGGKDIPAYVIYFKRPYQDIEAKGIRGAFCYAMNKKDRLYYGDVFHLIVNDDGIFEFYWSGNKSYEVLENNQEQFSMEQILDIFDLEMQDFKLTDVNGLYEYRVDGITVNRIDLNYIIVQDEAYESSYVAIPVYDFIGDIKHEAMPGMVNSETSQEDVCFMTIGALDGQVYYR